MNTPLYHCGEFRLVWLYLPAVLFHGWFATKDVFIIDVYWDSIFYKQLAFGLADWNTFHIQNHFPVPPLYSFFLSFAVMDGDYILTETLQSWLNPAIYFLGLIPTYKLTRLFLSRHYGILAAVLFIAYPTGVYTQWTLSENLSFPLSLFCFYFAAKSLSQPSFSKTDSFYFGLLCAANLLTRIQSIAFVFPLALWCIFRRWRNHSNAAELFEACSGGVILWIFMLFYLGYFEAKGDWVLYSTTDEQIKRSVVDYILAFLNRFYAHWTALWIEGALLLPTIPLAGLLASKFGAIKLNSSQREILHCWFIVSLCLVGSISFYRLLRLDVEYWSVSLRHLSYVNLLAIPLAFFVLDSFVHSTKKAYAILCFLTAALILWGSMFLPEVWPGLVRPATYFSNAPTLDFMEQLKSTGPLLSGIMFLVISIAVLSLMIRFMIAGLMVWIVLLLYIYGCSMDYINQDRRYAIERMGYEDIHLFCAQLEEGRWNEYTIYCMEDERVQYLRPNLRYWINRYSAVHVQNKPMPEPPFLYLTFRDDASGELVFLSGDLKAYLFR